MPKESNVWKYFTPERDDNGKQIGKATCNKCADGKQFDTKGGTTNMWRHFLNDFTHIIRDYQGDKANRVQCNICRSSLKVNGRKPSLVEVEHVMACIEQQNTPAVGESQPPPAQTRALPVPVSGSSSMEIEPADPQVQPLLPVQTRAQTGSGSSSMDLEPTSLGAQLPPLPSDPSCTAGPSSGGESGMDEPSKHLSRMIVLRGYDPSIVDDDCFRSFLGSLKPEFKVPSRVEIERECDRIFDEARRDLLSRLCSSRGRVCLAAGRTKTVDKDVSMYTACHFIDDEWMLRKLVLKACVLVDHYSLLNGPILGVPITYSDCELPLSGEMEPMLDYMPNHGVSNKVSMLTYETKDKDRCIYLKDYISDTRTTTGEIFCTTYVDKVLHDIAQWFVPDDVELVIDLSQGVEELHLTREERQQLISHLDLDDPRMYHDENWYGMYCSLKVLRMESSNATDSNSFGELLSKVCDGRKHLVMAKYDHYNLEFLCKVWKVVHHAIQRISAPSYPTSHLCLEVLLHMREFLQSELTELSIPNMMDVPYGFRLAIKTLDEAIKGSYLVWSIPLALDPRYKLQHIFYIFQKAFEPVVATEYYSKVKKKITDMYHDYKTDEVRTSTGAGHSDSGVVEAAGGADWDDPMHQWDWPAELKRYICDPTPRADDFDILNWWKRNSQKYPTLARMARDALAMPTCSKPSSDEIAQIKSIVRGYSKKPLW